MFGRRCPTNSGAARTLCAARGHAYIAMCLLAAAVSVVWPALATAQGPSPTLVSARPCFSAATGIELTGDGWTPGGEVRLQGRYVETDQRALDVTVRADDAGRIKFESAYHTDLAVRSLAEVTASDLTRLAAGAPAEQREAVTRFTLSWFGPFYRPWNTNGPARGRPGRVRTLEASGYIRNAGQTLYAHYLRVRDERFRTVRVGVLRGACGSLRVRFREFKFRPVRAGTYRVFFDTNPRATEFTFDSPGYRRVVVRPRDARR